MLAPLLMIAQAAAADPVVAQYLDRTRAEVPCLLSDDPADITVCGRREADQYRVPFVTPPENDRDRPLDMADRLLDGQTEKCGITSRVLTRCGMVGVSTKIGLDGKVTRERPLAP